MPVLPILPTQRTLYYVHIMHTRRELGLDSIYHQLGWIKRGWIKQPDIQILREWNRIKQKLELLPTPKKMYNDSHVKSVTNGPPEIILPQIVPFKILDMSRDKRLGPNDMVLIDLSRKGCSLVLCENKNLHRNQFRPNNKSYEMKIMFARNDFIANEIHESLGPEDIGVLFLGTRHNLDNHMLETLDTFGLCVKELNESEYTKMSLEEFLERD